MSTGDADAGPSLLSLPPELVSAFARFLPTKALARLQIAVCGDSNASERGFRTAVLDGLWIGRKVLDEDGVWGSKVPGTLSARAWNASVFQWHMEKCASLISWDASLASAAAGLGGGITTAPAPVSPQSANDWFFLEPFLKSKYALVVDARSLADSAGSLAFQLGPGNIVPYPRSFGNLERIAFAGSSTLTKDHLLLLGCAKDLGGLLPKPRSIDVSDCASVDYMTVYYLAGSRLALRVIRSSGLGDQNATLQQALAMCSELHFAWPNELFPIAEGQEDTRPGIARQHFSHGPYREPNCRVKCRLGIRYQNLDFGVRWLSLA
jgi:hypothetical protein